MIPTYGTVGSGYTKVGEPLTEEWYNFVTTHLCNEYGYIPQTSTTVGASNQYMCDGLYAGAQGTICYGLVSGWESSGDMAGSRMLGLSDSSSIK